MTSKRRGRRGNEGKTGREESRHLDTITVTLLAIGTAALAGNLFLADLSNIPVVGGTKPMSWEGWLNTAFAGTAGVAYATMSGITGIALLSRKRTPADDAEHKLKSLRYEYFAFCAIVAATVSIFLVNIISAPTPAI